MSKKFVAIFIWKERAECGILSFVRNRTSDLRIFTIWLKRHKKLH